MHCIYVRACGARARTVNFGPVGILRDPRCALRIPLRALFESSPTSRMSAEPGRTQPYHLDLRWRIIYQRIGMNKSFKDIAKNLIIGQGTAHRIVSHFVATGNVNPSTRGESCFRKLSKRNELFVIGLILNNPSMYSGEICYEINQGLGINISVSLVCNLLRDYGITQKKIRQVASQQSGALRGAFLSQCLLLDPAMIVWVDESGTDQHDSIRSYGYALQGMTPVSHRFLLRRKRINVIATMSLNDGILATEMYSSTINGDKFYYFIRGTLIPNMLPFNGPNYNSVVVMDNCSIHHIEPVTSLLENAGVVTMFLPPYCPDLNPIEEVFSLVKGYLRKHNNIIQHLQWSPP